MARFQSLSWYICSVPLFLRYYRCLLVSAVSVLLLSGCGAAVSRHWRDDATARFNTALSAGVERFAPEETDNIRQTLELAERYYKSDMLDDADRLYQLSCQKSQLLYRNLVVSKIRQGATVAVDDAKKDAPRELLLADEPVSLQQIVQGTNVDDGEESDETAEREVHDKTPPTVRPDSNNEQASTAVASQLSSPRKHREASKAKSELPAAAPGMKAARISSSLQRRHTSAPASSATTLYLTFDDGPSRLTVPIASFLSSNGISATFFALGNNIKGREKTLATLVGMGHRVGNHTLSHNLKKLNASLQRSENEIQRTAALVDNAGGDGKLVRIPYGASNKSLVATAKAEGAQIFDWDINSNDSTRQGAKNHQIIEHTVLKHLRQARKRHLILLFHDGAGHDATLTALKTLIPHLKQEGYHFGLLARRETVAAGSAPPRKQLP